MSAETEVSFEDAAKLGFKVIEMADRVRPMDRCARGSQAKSSLTIDETTYEIFVRVAAVQPGPAG